MTDRISSLSRGASRWFLLCALVYAPWAYGCTTTETISGLNTIIATALILRLFGLFLERRSVSSDSFRENIPVALALGSAALLVIGWWMVINGKFIYDSDYYLFIARHSISPAAPGSIDLALSHATMVRVTLLLGVILLAFDLSQEPAWLLRLWWTIAISGGSIAFFGLVEKATDAKRVFWQPSNIKVPTFFATYPYHANAGAYLNLVLPAVAALPFFVFMRAKTPVARAAALLPLLVVMVATITNTSRMGQVVSAFLAMGIAFRFRRVLFASVRDTQVKTSLLTLGVMSLVMLEIARASRIDLAFARWQDFFTSYGQDARWQAARGAFRAVADTGFFGFGPGTFRVLFPYYTAGLPMNIAGTWRFLHEDYLQTLLEWGWIGGACCAFVFFGGIFVAIKNSTTARAQAKWRPRQRFFLSVSVLSLAGIALHALVDFPFQIASLQLYVAVYLGVCWGSNRWILTHLNSRPTLSPQAETP